MKLFAVMVDDGMETVSCRGSRPIALFKKRKQAKDYASQLQGKAFIMKYDVEFISLEFMEGESPYIPPL